MGISTAIREALRRPMSLSWSQWAFMTVVQGTIGVSLFFLLAATRLDRVDASLVYLGAELRSHEQVVAARAISSASTDSVLREGFRSNQQRLAVVEFVLRSHHWMDLEADTVVRPDAMPRRRAR